MEMVSAQKAMDAPLYLTSTAFQIQNLQKTRKAIIAAKLQRMPVILQLTEALPEVFLQILPLCNVIIGTLTTFEKISGLKEIEGLNYFREKTDALLVVYTDHHQYQIIDGECPAVMSFKAMALTDKHPLIGQFAKDYFFIPRTLQISS